MPKILLVEDDSMISDIYQRKFSDSGFEVVIAASGKEVLEKVKANAFDLVLLDLILPEMDGMEVLKELRTNSEYDPELKVIIFSNLNDREQREKALELGANGFVSKTEYIPSKLVEEVSRYLHQFDQQKKNQQRFENGGAVEPKNKRILFVEDEEIFAEIFGGRLENEGYEVEFAANGSIGLQKASKGGFDLIITDMVMPGLSGKELIDRLRMEEGTKNTPIFLLSASMEEDCLMEEASGNSIRCFMKTRLVPSQLTDEVNAVLA